MVPPVISPVGSTNSATPKEYNVLPASTSRSFQAALATFFVVLFSMVMVLLPSVTVIKHKQKSGPFPARRQDAVVCWSVSQQFPFDSLPLYQGPGQNASRPCFLPPVGVSWFQIQGGILHEHHSHACPGHGACGALQQGGIPSAPRQNRGAGCWAAWPRATTPAGRPFGKRWASSTTSTLSSA